MAAVHYVTSPALEPARRAAIAFRGPLGARIRANERHWLASAPDANPAMLQMFRDRDRLPPRDLVPWAGEFAGKYLTSAAPALRLSGGSRLTGHLRSFVDRLIETQHPSGYFGPFPLTERMTGKDRWDLWGQYHAMAGLLAWHGETGDCRALAACLLCADRFCDAFLETGRRVLDAGWEEMNESCIHAFVRLYALTGNRRYLALAREIEKDWEAPPSGDHVRQAIAGKPFWQHPKPRWESLHGIQAIAELYFLTGDSGYRRAFETIWRSIMEGDRHNTGGFSSGEQATGNPYDPGAIETCCTIAWMALTLDYLRMTGAVEAADELELSTWNAVLGSQHPSGRWWTYNTPMDGERKASAHDIVFQARAGSPELNCCSVNGPRGLGMLADWSLLERRAALFVTHYAPGTRTVVSADGSMTLIWVGGSYPLKGRIPLLIRRFNSDGSVFFRIPSWSSRTRVSVDGGPAETVSPGDWWCVEAGCGSTRTLQIDLDMAPRLWQGERECEGKVSIYRGPVLLAYDPRFGPWMPDDLPEIDASAIIRGDLAIRRGDAGDPRPVLFVDAPLKGGGTATLCDFASAGAAGNPYRSWLPSR